MKSKICYISIFFVLFSVLVNAIDIHPCILKWKYPPTGEYIYTIAYGSDLASCMMAAGGIVGGFNDCASNCESCCSEYCANAVGSPGTGIIGCGGALFIGGILHQGCVESCKSSCKIKESINNIKAIILYIALILAGIMFLVFAYKFITSANPEDRNEAKRGLLYVILALLIIGIADPLINVMLPKPKPESDIGLVLYSAPLTADYDGKGKGEVFPLDPKLEDPKLSDNLVGNDPQTVQYLCLDPDYCDNVKVCLYDRENFEDLIRTISGKCEPDECCYIYRDRKPSSIKIIDARESC